MAEGATTVEILAVDDTPANLRSLEALLGDELDARLVKASSGDEALRLLLSREFALILLDIQMPSMNGLEAAALIRSRDRCRHVPIIFLTAHNRDEAQVREAYSLGAVDFLFKPIVPEILRSKVNVFLELHRKTDEVRRQAELLRQAEKRDYERSLAQARQRYERELLEQQMEKERRLAETLEQRALDLGRLLLEKEEAQSALRQVNERLAVLADSANRLLLAREPEALLPTLYEKLAGHLGLEMYAEFRVEESGKVLRLNAHHGLTADGIAAYGRLPLGEGISGRVARERQRLVVEGLQLTADPALEVVRNVGISSGACFPLVSQDRLLGTILFGTAKDRTFSPDELSLMQLFADQIGVCLERSALIAELRDGDRRKNEFLAMLAHELRNPLAPVNNALEIFKSFSNDHEVLCRAIASADRQVTHMTRLVDDLLDVSRITRGKVELRRSIVELHTLVDQAVQSAEPLLRQRRHALTVRLPEQPLQLYVDPTRLAQVLGNLLHNAAKYTDPGGTVSLNADLTPDELSLRIRDSGIGLTPELLPRVFEAFMQVDPGSDRAQGGLGLGLTLVRSLVEMHGGTVEASSEGPGAGSEFVVRLPLARVRAPEAPADAQPAADSNAPLPALSILLVEDNPDIRSTLRDLLELRGHTVEEAPDGPRGVELLLELRPDLALVDIGLPGLDGYRVAERVRGEGVRGTRLVALTGYGGAEDRRKALEAGFDAHLVKPVSAAELTRVMRELFLGTPPPIVSLAS